VLSANLGPPSPQISPKIVDIHGNLGKEKQGILCYRLMNPFSKGNQYKWLSMSNIHLVEFWALSLLYADESTFQCESMQVALELDNIHLVGILRPWRISLVSQHMHIVPLDHHSSY